MAHLSQFVTPLLPNLNSFDPIFVLNYLNLVSLAFTVACGGSFYSFCKSKKHGSLSLKQTGLVYYVKIGLILLLIIGWLKSLTTSGLVDMSFLGNGDISFSGNGFNSDSLLTSSIGVLGGNLLNNDNLGSNDSSLGFSATNSASGSNRFYYFLPLINLFVIFLLSTISVLYSPISISSLLLFWPFLQIFHFIIYYQEFTSFPLIDLNVLCVPLPLIIWLLEYAYYKPTLSLILAYSSDENLRKLLFKPNIIDRHTFRWMNQLILTARNTHIISEFGDDFPNHLNVENTKEKFLKHYNPANLSSMSIVFALVKSFGKLALLSFFFELCTDLIGFVHPQLLRLLILYFEDDFPILKGILISLLIFTFYILQIFTQSQYFLVSSQVALSCQSALLAVIYSKSLKISNGSVGDIVNLISIDANRIQNVALDVSTLVLAPIEIVLCIVSLWPLLGKATFAGILTMIILLPLNSFIVRYTRSLNKKQMKIKDKRTSIIQEIIMSIKSIKLFAWEQPMLRKLLNVRNNEELVNLRKIRIINQVSVLIWNMIPFFVAFFSFSTFVLISKIPLTSDIVFPALALLNLLSGPLLSLPASINNMIEASVALSRINKFLHQDELNPILVENTNDNSISVKGTFAWGENIVLQNIDLEVKCHELYCVVGKVGSGKSSLLAAILGQLKIVGEGSIKIGNSVAYCEQSPWIMNASVKENITFGHRWDPEFYEKTLSVCQLVQDLKVLSDGDDTLVGEKGVQLSGGQKARLSLARAVYSRADIYLLDDILSAVDSHVGKRLMEDVLFGFLKGKTVILSTNSISVLKYANKISLIEDGSIIETVSSIDVEVKDHPKLFELLDEFGSKNAEEIFPNSISVSEAKHTRRASVETFKWDPLEKLLPNLNVKNNAEVSAKGKVKMQVYSEYFKATSLAGVLTWVFAMISAAILSVLSNYWLKSWTEKNADPESANVWQFIGMYALFGFSAALVRSFSSSIIQIWLSIKASKLFHNRMAYAVLHSPISFFEQTPSGRIMNRFTNDMNKLDSSMSGVFAAFFSRLVSTILTLGVVGYVMPPFIIVIVLLSFVYMYYQTSYVAASRELKRLVSISKSPIYAHLGESLVGINTIRAFKQIPRFTYINHANTNFNVRAVYMLRSISRWLSSRLQFVGALGILTASLLAVSTTITSYPLTSSMAGFVMTYALQVTGSLRMVVRMSAEMEVDVVAVERCLEYCQLNTEKLEGMNPPLTWPASGSIKFDNYSAKYRPELANALKNISFSIKSGEKIGVVGRTGSGKSTLALAIFRIIEASEGSISVDDIITSGVKLEDLRHRLSTIPQDSQLISGTLRENLDPFQYFTDDEIWHALKLAHLKETVLTLTGELEFVIEENGANFSQGQRQLISLARVLLKMNKCKILVLDEATASVDVQTDRIVQQTIRSEFSDKTIITIAHRLETIMDSDKILSLDSGEIKEFDSPKNLLQNKNGIFYSLCVQGGQV